MNISDTSNNIIVEKQAYEPPSVTVSVGGPSFGGGASFDTLDFSLPSYGEATSGSSDAKSDAPKSAPSFSASFPELKLPGATEASNEPKASAVDEEAAVKKAEEEKAAAKNSAEEEKAAAKKTAEEEKAAKAKVCLLWYYTTILSEEEILIRFFQIIRRRKRNALPRKRRPQKRQQQQRRKRLSLRLAKRLRKRSKSEFCHDHGNNIS